MTFLPDLDMDLECCLLLECFAGDPAQSDDPALTPAQLRARTRSSARWRRRTTR